MKRRLAPPEGLQNQNHATAYSDEIEKICWKNFPAGEGF
jgi:hypothetical protein